MFSKRKIKKDSFDYPFFYFFFKAYPKAQTTSEGMSHANPKLDNGKYSLTLELTPIDAKKSGSENKKVVAITILKIVSEVYCSGAKFRKISITIIG